MPAPGHLLLALGLATGLAAGSARAQDCQPDVPWQHVHDEAKSHIMTTDVKGTRNSRIEICRSDEPSGKNVVVELVYPGVHEARALAGGKCADKAAKWAVIRSRGAKGADSTATVSGVYRLCKE